MFFLWNVVAKGFPPLRKERSGSGLHTAPRQPQLCRDPFHRFNAERDVLFQIDAQIGSAVDDVIAIHAAGKSFVLHLLADGLCFHLSQ
jgi:hypothetical protein